MFVELPVVISRSLSWALLAVLEPAPVCAIRAVLFCYFTVHSLDFVEVFCSSSQSTLSFGCPECNCVLAAGFGESQLPSADCQVSSW